MDGGFVAEGPRIGPNAILQLIPVLDAAIGPQGRAALFARSGVLVPPADAGMMPQDQVIRLHHTVAMALPDRFAEIANSAGAATGDYILANRIPTPAQTLIRILPRPLGARLLAAAIAKHAWTFAGSGRFAVVGHRPLIFRIEANPLAVGMAGTPSCHWHSAVFQRLFQALVWPAVTVTETTCCACGDAACTFKIAPAQG
jgi:divinyl protochlorophyllide a 8-vinyl-reductase